MAVEPYVICWLRRDLRLIDNHALYQAIQSGMRVQLLFIFDTNILQELPSSDRRVSIIYNRLKDLNDSLVNMGGSLQIAYGKPSDVFRKLVSDNNLAAVYANEDYEPYATDRDNQVSKLLLENRVGFHLFTDHLLVEPSQILKSDNTPYTIFTPWSKKWFEKIKSINIPHYDTRNLKNSILNQKHNFPTIEEVGFENTGDRITEVLPSNELLSNYLKERDFPALDNTSHMSIALRFGIVSIRKLFKHSEGFNVYVNELAWREFYAMIIFRYPQVVTRAFKKQYENIAWRNNEDEFERWKAGKTGYPIVDAGMRQLLETGFMHNRVRMITASFLTKHLLVDWRWGEAWFAEKLLDYELASNNGGWQWAASTGCDAVPYFRIFNPTLQMEKFDKELIYVRRWVSEYDTFSYPQPIVDHKHARLRAIETYKKALSV